MLPGSPDASRSSMDFMARTLRVGRLDQRLEGMGAGAIGPGSQAREVKCGMLVIPREGVRGVRRLWHFGKVKTYTTKTQERT